MLDQQWSMNTTYDNYLIPIVFDYVLTSEALILVAAKEADVVGRVAVGSVGSV